MKEIILASASPRRRELLALAGVDFTVQTADVEEKTTPGLTPAETVKQLAEIKAAAVAEKIRPARLSAQIRLLHQRAKFSANQKLVKKLMKCWDPSPAKRTMFTRACVL